MPAAVPSPSQSSVDASQFHSEFGYLAPTIRFRRKVALTLKGGTLGVLVGAVAMFFVVMDRGEERAFTMLSSPAATMPVPPTSAAAPIPAPPAAAPSPALAVAAPAAPVVAMPMSSKPGAPANESRLRVATAPASASVPLTPAQLAAINAARVRFVPESLAVPVATGARGVAPVPEAPPDLISQMSLIAAVPPATQVKAAPKPKKKIVREQPERTALPAPIQPEPRSALAAEAPVPRFLRSIFGL